LLSGGVDVRRRLVGGLLVAVLVGVMGVEGWTILRARTALLDARTHTAQLRAALEGNDLPAARTALEALQADATDAANATGGLRWSAITWVPRLGDDLDAVRRLATALHTVAYDGLPGLVDAADELDGGSLTPHPGQIDVAALTGLRAPVAAAVTAFDSAGAELAAVDPLQLAGGFAEQFSSAVDDLASASSALDSARRSVEALPSMLGADGTRKWLLIFQNNAELRATGGLPGAMTVLTASGGKVTMGVQQPSLFEVAARPILPLTRFESVYHGPQLGTYFQDANLTPDFPRAAELWRAWWQRDLGERIDGVIALDPVALSYLLDATGPMPSSLGTVTADNAIRMLLHEPYLRLDPAAQDAYFAEMSRQVFDRLTSGAVSTTGLLTALSRAASERRLLVHSFSRAEQDALDGTAVAGSLWDTEPGAPRIDIGINDATASKMQYFLRYDVAARATCVDGRQHYDVTLDVRSVAPATAAQLPYSVTGGGQSATPAGSQFLAFDIYGPPGGTVGAFQIDGEEVVLFRAKGGARIVVQLPVELRPGERQVVTWSMVAAEADHGRTSLNVTPGVESGSRSLMLPGACAS